MVRRRRTRPDLITVKGRRLVEQAGAILYVVDVATTRFAPPGCRLQDSKAMTLEQIVAWLAAAGEWEIGGK